MSLAISWRPIHGGTHSNSLVLGSFISALSSVTHLCLHWFLLHHSLSLKSVHKFTAFHNQFLPGHTFPYNSMGALNILQNLRKLLAGAPRPRIPLSITASSIPIDVLVPMLFLQFIVGLGVVLYVHIVSPHLSRGVMGLIFTTVHENGEFFLYKVSLFSAWQYEQSIFIRLLFYTQMLFWKLPSCLRRSHSYLTCETRYVFSLLALCEAHYFVFSILWHEMIFNVNYSI